MAVPLFFFLGWVSLGAAGWPLGYAIGGVYAIVVALRTALHS